MSGSGYYMAVPSGNNYKFISVSTKKQLGTLYAKGVTDAAFAPSPYYYVYLAAGNNVLKAKFDGTKPATIVTDTGTVAKVAASADGKKLAYVSYNSSTGTNQLVGYDLTTSMESYRVPLASQPTAIQFTPDSSKVVADGPNVFNAATGASVLSSSSDAGPYAMAWDGSYIVEWNASSPSVLDCRSLSDASLLWSMTPSVTNYVGGSIALTYTGDRVMIPGRTDSGKVAIWIYKTSDGSYVSTVTPSPRTDVVPNPAASKVSIASNPSNYILAVTEDVPSATDDYVVNETYNIFSNSTANLRADFTGAAGPITSMFMTKTNVASGAPLVIYGSSTGIGNTSGNVVVRNADTGDLVRAWSGVPLSSNKGAVGLSTDGKYAAYCSTAGFTVRNVSTGASLGSVPIDSRSLAWIDSASLLVSTGDNWFRRYTVSGGSPVLVSSIRSGAPAALMAVNQTGTVALALGPASTQWTRIDLAANTARVYQSTTTGQVTFVDFDQSGFAFVGQNDSATTMQMRKWDLTLPATPVAVMGYSRTFPSPVDTPYYAVGPDGKYVVIGANYTTSEGNVSATYLINTINNLTALTWDKREVGDGINCLALSPTDGYMVWGRKDPNIIAVAVPAAVGSVTVNPNPAVGGNTLAGAVNMTAATPGEFGVFLMSSNPSVAAVPYGLTLPANATTLGFDVTTATVDSPTTVTITAYTAQAWQTVDLLINPAAPATLSVPTALSTGTTTGTVTLDGKAGPSGITVNLTSNSSALTVPATVSIPAGSSSATFDMTVTAGSEDVPVTLTASANGTTITANTTVTNSIQSIAFTPTTACGGTTTYGVVTLNYPAKAGGQVVTLSSSDATNAPVPATVTVAAGSTTGKFSIATGATSPSKTVTVTGGIGTLTATGSFTLDLPGAKTLVLTRSSVVGGNRASATLTLTGTVNAPVTINLTSSDPSFATVPATITVPANSNTVLVNIDTVAVGANKTVTITASRANTSVSVTLTITPPR